jgi:tRNA threonylcarbamoyladenosine modification (KEOPS) complex  Pcc1 subunit
MIFSLVLELFFDLKKSAEIVFKSIKPDLKNLKKSRSISTVSLKNNVIKISIKAKDLTALKASFNFLLKQIILVNSLIEKEVEKYGATKPARHSRI